MIKFKVTISGTFKGMPVMTKYDTYAHSSRICEDAAIAAWRERGMEYDLVCVEYANPTGADILREMATAI